MKKKVGIITYYYKSNNYGGLLQAYALQKIIDNLGFESYQISYNYNRNEKKDSLKSKIKKILYSFLTYKKRRKNNKLLKGRIYKNFKFMDSIPHTKPLDFSNINILNNQFDLFVAGSDQVWNPEGKVDNFFLKFVNDDSKKISYAASLGKGNLSEADIKYLIPLINKFKSISIRENECKEILEKEILKKVNVNLDPTLLLSKEEWLKIIEKEKKIKERYIFVYLLGNNENHKKMIKKISNYLNLKIVFIPHIHLNFNKKDLNFADYELLDIDPKEFLGLIKNSEMVITDSFHGCVFSILFEKKFWTLKRNSDENSSNMNSRIYSLFENLKIKNRFLDENLKLEKDKLLENICYKSINIEIEKLKKDSIDFLKNALGEN